MRYTKFVIFNPSCLEYSRPRISQTEPAAQLENSCNLLTTNKVNEALAGFLELREKLATSKDIKITAYLGYHIGLCYKKLALLKDGESGWLKAMAALEDTLQKIHSRHEILEYAIAYNDLGFIYQSLADYQNRLEYQTKARNSFEKAQFFLEQSKKSCNPKQDPVGYMMILYHLGNSYNALAQFNNDEKHFETAILYYEQAILSCRREQFISIYALTQFSLGFAYHAAAEFHDPEENHHKAMSAYQAALTIFNPDEYPLEYSHTQNCLANLYIDLTRVSNQEEYLNKAIVASKEVLNILTSITGYQIGYALILHNLGSACKLYSNIRNNQDYLDKALHYFEAILTIENLPPAAEIIASTHLNLGLIYHTRARRIAGSKDCFQNLTKAITSFQTTLQFYSAAEYPVKYAITQSNLGDAYRDIHHHQPNTSDLFPNLSKSIEAYLEAAKFFNNDLQHLLDYVVNQFKLGNVYLELAKNTHEEANIVKAVQSYEAGLVTLSPETNPVEYADLQNGLADTYRFWVESFHKEEGFTKAFEGYQTSLKILAQTQYPEKHADTLSKLAEAYYAFAKIRNKELYLTQGSKAFQEALKIFTNEKYPKGYTHSARLLGLVYLDLAEIRQKEFYLNKAVKLFNELVAIYSSENNSEKLAEIQSLLGKAYMNLANNPDESANAVKALQCFEMALKYYTIEHFPEEFAVNMKNIGNTYKTMAELAKSFDFKNIEEFRDYKVDRISNAQEAYQAALRVFTIEAHPLEYAKIKLQIGEAYNLLAMVQDKKDCASIAVTIFEDALQVFTAESYPAEYKKVKLSLEKTKQMI